jgi:hypothetical protein
VSDNNTYVFKNIRTFVGPATGGERGPCDATLVEDAIQWTCFTGLGVDEETDTTFGKYESWLFSRNGKILRYWKS